MEQKQLDEIDESYFGEEFIDEELLEEEERPVLKKEKVVKEKETFNAKKVKAVKMAEKTPSSKEVKEESVIITPLSSEQPSQAAKTSKKEEKKVIETASPVDPWAEGKGKEPGFLTQTPTWKAVAGILLVLLVLSVLTNGFHFTQEKEQASISALEAQSQVLDFVNTNVLQPPFAATAKEPVDIGSVYKITLEIAGQEIDSYLTKDGSLFFPQGFDPHKPILKEESIPTQLEGEPQEPTSEVNQTTKPSNETGAEEEVLVVTQPKPTTTMTSVEVSSRKWSFSPDRFVVNVGEEVELVINPDNSNSAFALPRFTFAIPDLNVRQEVDGPTTVKFKAEKVGTFEFSCASCEEFRGMRGAIVVK